MKKYFSLFLVAFLVLFPLAACGTKNKNGEKSFQIVTTIFPEYDWVSQILGSHADEAEVTMLLDNGVDLHSYQPTVDDIIKVSNSDMFIYVGGESDEWADDALKGAINKDMVVINLLDVLGNAAKEEEIKEGMEAEEETEEEGEEEPEYDEHVWLSLKNATIIVQHISDKLCQMDKSNSEDYKKNTADYVSKLNALDEEYQDTVASAKIKTVLFGDRFPFRYMFDDYNLDYYAAFVGCSAETEASFKTIGFLAGKVDELKLPAVVAIEGAEHKIGETIIQNTKDKNQKILTMDSMQSTTTKDVKAGTTYLSVMTANLEIIKEALNY